MRSLAVVDVGVPLAFASDYTCLAGSDEIGSESFVAVPAIGVLSGIVTDLGTDESYCPCIVVELSAGAESSYSFLVVPEL